MATDAQKATIAQKTEAARQKLLTLQLEAANRKALSNNKYPKYVQPAKQTGNAETDSKADLTELQKGFRKRAADESKRFAMATDSEHWACLCFQTREQSIRFLKAMDILWAGDKYLDGVAVAKHLGIDLSKDDVPYNPEPRIDPDWVKLVK